MTIDTLEPPRNDNEINFGNGALKPGETVYVTKGDKSGGEQMAIPDERDVRTALNTSELLNEKGRLKGPEVANSMYSTRIKDLQQNGSTEPRKDADAEVARVIEICQNSEFIKDLGPTVYAKMKRDAKHNNTIGKTKTESPSGLTRADGVVMDQNDLMVDVVYIALNQVARNQGSHPEEAKVAQEILTGKLTGDAAVKAFDSLLERGIAVEKNLAIDPKKPAEFPIDRAGNDTHAAYWLELAIARSFTGSGNVLRHNAGVTRQLLLDIQSSRYEDNDNPAAPVPPPTPDPETPPKKKEEDPSAGPATPPAAEPPPAEEKKKEDEAKTAEPKELPFALKWGMRVVAGVAAVRVAIEAGKRAGEAIRNAQDADTAEATMNRIIRGAGVAAAAVAAGAAVIGLEQGAEQVARRGIAPTLAMLGGIFAVNRAAAEGTPAGETPEGLVGRLKAKAAEYAKQVNDAVKNEKMATGEPKPEQTGADIRSSNSYGRLRQVVTGIENIGMASNSVEKAAQGVNMAIGLFEQLIGLPEKVAGKVDPGIGALTGVLLDGVKANKDTLVARIAEKLETTENASQRLEAVLFGLVGLVKVAEINNAMPESEKGMRAFLGIVAEEAGEFFKVSPDKVRARREESPVIRQRMAVVMKDVFEGTEAANIAVLEDATRHIEYRYLEERVKGWSSDIKATTIPAKADEEASVAAARVRGQIIIGKIETIVPEAVLKKALDAGDLADLERAKAGAAMEADTLDKLTRAVESYLLAKEVIAARIKAEKEAAAKKAGESKANKKKRKVAKK